MIHLERLVECRRLLAAQSRRRFLTGNLIALWVQNRDLESHIGNLALGAFDLCLHADGRGIGLDVGRGDDGIPLGDSDRGRGGEPNVAVNARAGIPT